jgi:hypothetical protein
MDQICSGKATKIFGIMTETHYTFSIVKTILLILILMAISLPFSSSLKINFDSPSSVNINEEFTVSIDADSSDPHDVKVFVHKSSDKSIQGSEYISEILDTDWSNPWFYIKEAFPDKTEFKIRVIESPGDRSICVRLRKTETETVSTECDSITIEEAQDEQEHKKEEPEKVEKDEEKIEVDQLNSSSDDFPSQLSFPSSIENEKLLLNTNKNPDQEIITKTEKKRTGIIYAFTALMIIIIVLLALRRL